MMGIPSRVRRTVQQMPGTSSRNLITRMLPPIPLSWPGLTRPSSAASVPLDGRINTRVKPECMVRHDSGAKFPMFFKALFAGGDIWVIKSRKGKALSGIESCAFCDPGSRFAWPGRRFAIASLVLFGSLAPVSAADKRYPDWPCRQLKVPVLSPAAMWTGPSIEGVGNAWEEAPGLPELVAHLAARRTPMAEAEKAIADYLTGTPAEKQEKAKLLFAGLLETLNGERTQVMNGLERASRKQKGVAESIREVAAKFRELQDAPNPDQAQIEDLGRQIEWRTRIFDERRKTMNFACEVPIEIEQRLFGLARAIQGALG